jgi:guanylate kinase
MNATPTRRLAILSGPSYVGKSPLKKAMGKFYPQLASRLRKLVFFNCRGPASGRARRGRLSFRTRSQIEGLKSDKRYAVLEVRGDLRD